MFWIISRTYKYLSEASRQLINLDTEIYIVKVEVAASLHFTYQLNFYSLENYHNLSHLNLPQGSPVSFYSEIAELTKQLKRLSSLGAKDAAQT